MMNGPTKCLIKFVMYIVQCILAPFIWLVNMGKSKKLPRISNPLLLMTATRLAHMIRNKEVKAEDVIKAFISRCKEVNPIINAIVGERFDQAIAEARQVDILLASEQHTVEELEKKYPLLGVPVTVKESLAVAGMSNAAGKGSVKTITASHDAESIVQVKAAGAIPFLVSNTPEFCLNWETYNNVTGTTRNPYDTRRTPGGSSGGEAALLSSGASVVGVGSDVAGSLRLPAHYTGVYGHKPTPWAVSTVGHMPTSNSPDWNSFFSVGPMTRYAEDLPLLLKVLKDPRGPELQLDKKVNIKEMKFYYMEGDDVFITKKIDKDVKNALDKVIKHFYDKHNIVVEKAKLKNMKYSFEASVLRILKLDGVETIYSKPDNPHEWVSIWPEVLKKIVGCSKWCFTSVMYGLLKRIADNAGDKRFKEAEKVNTELKEEFLQLLGNNAVCFHPTFYEPAQFHHNYLRNLLNYNFLIMFNSLGLPVTNCPLGLTPQGLPVGIQVVANPKCDHLTLAVAKELEEAFGGWVEP